jgi:tetratricopeptide (TPR) repeat protein
MLRAISTLSLALAVALAATLSAAPASAQARNGNPLIRQGQQQYDDLEFEQALQTLSAALIRAGNSAEENATTYRLLAYTYLALGREEEAAGAYRGLLALQPDTTPGTELAPQTRTFFEGVKQSWESDGRPGYQARPPAPVTIRHRSPAQAERGNAVALEATVDDADARVRTLVVAFHQGASESGDREVFQRLEATREGETFRATLPASVIAPPLVEYYLEALDANGLPVAGRGDVAAPLRIAVPAPGRSILASPWFWVITGALVAGAVVTTVLLVGGDEGSQTPPGAFVIDIN